ncbi:MAG TPA: DUF2690 domain-containing protein, partial [Ktedonobacteraceae bacterium]
MISIREKIKTLTWTRLLLYVPLMTLLFLLIRGNAGFSFVSVAHAQTRTGQVPPQSPCTADPGEATCNNQNPVLQGCGIDAQTLAYKDIPNAQGEVIAIVQRRYSPTCHSEWGRILEAAKRSLPIDVLMAGNDFSSTT